MLLKRLIQIILMVILLSSCNSKDNNSTMSLKDNKYDKLEYTCSGVALHNDKISIYENSNLEQNFKLLIERDNSLQVVKEEIIPGIFESIQFVDINNDDFNDILICSNEGGSWGTYHYYCYIYAKNTYEQIDINTLTAENHYKFSFQNNRLEITGFNKQLFIEADEIDEKTKEIIETEMNSRHKNEYEVIIWPVKISQSYDNNSNSVLTTRNLISISHKLCVIGEIQTDYIYSDGDWKEINTFVKSN